MPSYLRDVTIRNVVINDEALKEIHATFLERVEAHNSNTQDEDHKLLRIYIVRFDGRGYRTYFHDEAWNFYKSASTVERIAIKAESPICMRTSQMVGAQIEIRLDTDSNNSSHILVGGESKDWVEATFSAFETALNRRKDLATSLVRTQSTALIVQLLGVMVGLLLALWLASISAPYLKGVDYPRAVSFGFWFLVFSNLWTYLQQRTLDFIGGLFPNVRLSRSGDHWTHKLIRKGVEAAAIAICIWLLALLSKWAVSVFAPLLTTNT